MMPWYIFEQIFNRMSCLFHHHQQLIFVILQSSPTTLDIGILYTILCVLIIRIKFLMNRDALSIQPANFENEF